MKEFFLITLFLKFVSKFLKRMLLPTLILYFSFILKGQELPEIVPPSPTVANLMKFEEVPIDYYSGQPSISMPIFSKEIGQGVGINIGLNYSTSGVKIDNRSGWTGTGWSLFAGGAISRTVRDVADEIRRTDPGNLEYKTGVLHNSDFWIFDNLGSNVQEFLWKSAGSSLDKYDTNLDLYQFNFLNYTGRFVILKQGNILVPKLLSKNSNLKITLNYNSTSYQIDSFTVTDTKGYKYTFDIVENTNYYTNTNTLSQGLEPVATNGNGSNYSASSAWHLSKIESPNNNVLATFTYAVPYVETYQNAPSKAENKVVSSNPTITNLGSNSYNQSVMLPKYSTTYSSSATMTSKLSSITFRDDTSIHFITSSGHPEIGGGKILSSIKLKDKNNLIYKTYNLTYETVANRLWLVKMTKLAGFTTLETNLNYSNKNQLPSFGNGFSLGDDWGYYSGISNTNNSFSNDKISTGLLNQIIYPTGGVKEFEFENNSYSFYGNQVMHSDNYISLSPLQTIGTSITSQEMLGGGARIKSIKLRESSTNSISKHIIYEYKLENDVIKSSGVIDSKQDQPTRNYDIYITRILADLNGTLNSFTVPYSVKVRGPNMNVQMTKSNYVAYRHIKVSEVNFTSNGLENNGYSLYDYTSSYDYPTPSDVFSLPISKPSPNVDYKRGLLKKQRVFNKNNDILKQVENIYSFQEHFVYKERAVYKSEAAKQFYDTWNYYNISQGTSAEINQTPYPLLSYTWAGTGPMFHLSTDINAGWAKLSETNTKNYFYDDLNSQSVIESKKQYDYNPYNYRVASERNFVKENGGDIIYETINQYPLGIIGNNNKGGNSTTIINRLIALNKINEVLESETVRYEGSTTIGNGETLSKTYTKFNKINNDDNLILPVKISVGKGTTTPDSRIQFHSYDDFGNLIEVSQQDGTKIVYIWGYNKTLPVAKLENATYSQVLNYVANIQNKSNLDLDNTIDARSQNGDIIGYSGSEGQLRQTLNSLRADSNLSDALITTFTYNPTVGVTSITDSNGDTIYYKYDSFNRLETIKDAYGKVVSKNEYNYKN